MTSAAFKIGSTTDQTISYTYDNGRNGKGHLTGASDATHTMAWTYDAQGRVGGKSQIYTAVTPNVPINIGYGYNASGQLTSVVLPSGRTITFGYNANNQVTSVTLVGSPNTTILNNVTYAPFGPVTGWSWGNGTATTTRTYDTDGKLTAISNSTSGVGNRGFGYDDAFRITSATDSAASGPSWTLGYDILDRLNSASKSGTTIGYTYDPNGNRLTQTGTNASTYTVSTTSNKLSSTTGALTRSYTYDATGSVLTSGASIHTYNNRGRMKTARLSSTGTNTSYVYNALGQRMRKSGGTPGTVYFMYDEDGHLIGEYGWNATNQTLTVTQETVWLGDIPVATLRPSGSTVAVFYVHTDQLNTPRKITRPSDNQLRWRWDPTPFGEGAPNENPASLGAFKYNLRFPGQYFDVESSLNYNYSRNYDPSTARYSESDLIGLEGGLNPYSYVENSPAQFSDRRGEIVNLITGGLSSMAMGYVIAKITGDECYDWKDALTDFGTGAAGVGLLNKLRELPRLRKLREIASRAGMKQARSQKDTLRFIGDDYARLELKLKGNIPSPSGGLNPQSSWISRARLRVANGTYADPFTGEIGSRLSNAAHIPLELLPLTEAPVAGLATGALGGAARNSNGVCGCED